MKKSAVCVLALLILLSFAGCSGDRFLKGNEIKDIENNPEGTIVVSYLTPSEADEEDARTTIALDFELYYSKAPNTVTNFIKLVSDGFYDNTYCNSFSFPNSSGDEYLSIDAYKYNDDDSIPEQKTLDYTIKGEFSANGWTANDIKHIFGIMTMARGEDYDSANFEFKICLDTNSGMDDNYAAFGKITKISSTLTNDLINMTSLTVSDFKVISITVDTHGVDFGKPLMIKK